mmetsp:Transcript_23448/g.56618  ORF Transcript_23448/g.56618 Transcript_23448/m.56618 type:complete len:200 (+) Transcript_23448:106-705(+)
MKKCYTQKGKNYLVICPKTCCGLISTIISKNLSPASAFSFSPAFLPISTASAISPVASVWYFRDPSGMAINPRNTIFPSTIRAWPAMGVLQFPSSASKNARSQFTQTCVSMQFSVSIYFRLRSSSLRHWMPIAPCATAGSISSHSSTAVAQSCISMRFNPAMARSVASTTPSSSLRRRVWTLPRKLTHLSVGFCERSWA